MCYTGLERKVSTGSSEPFAGIILSKIRDCHMALVAWSRNMGSTRTWIEEKKQLQTLTAQNDPANLELIQRVRDDINTLLYQLRQRSRSIWLLAGYKNTKFFHQRASQRRHKNNLMALWMKGGDGRHRMLKKKEWPKGISKGISLLQTPLRWT